MISMWVKVSHLYKLNHVSFSVPKRKFDVSYLSYENLSHLLLTSSSGNMWPPFRASEGRLAQLMLTFGATITLLQDMNILAKVDIWRQCALFPKIYFCFFRLARLFVGLVRRSLMMTGRGTILGPIGSVGTANIHMTKLDWEQIQCWQIATSNMKDGSCSCGILLNVAKLMIRLWMDAACHQTVNTRRTSCQQKLWQSGTNSSGICVFKTTKETRVTLVKSAKSVK